jgi:SAM-dependent methyltransferase
MKIRCEYEEAGSAEQFYREKGALYRNPQEREVRAMLRAQLRPEELVHVLDLACGSGEAALEVMALGGTASCVDPFCGAACTERTGLPCVAASFEDVALGRVGWEPDTFSAIVCSFALHLLDPSYLPALLAALRPLAPALLVLSPHKRPHLRPEWGWRLDSETVQDRVRFRRYL